MLFGSGPAKTEPEGMDPNALFDMVDDAVVKENDIEVMIDDAGGKKANDKKLTEDE